MNLNFNVTGKARGKLANIIADALDQECTYMKAPTYAYQIGNFTITREGELEFDIADVSKDEIKTAVDAAKAAGFDIAEIDGEPAPQSPEIETAEDDGETAPEGETGVDGSEQGGLSIAFPHEGFNPQTLDNLNKMVESKGLLIKKALGVEELPILQDEESVAFPWFSVNATPDEITAYSQFITQLCKTAQAKKRVVAKPQESHDNPRFGMRVWLISLGLVGAEYAFCRKLLMQNLDGNSGFRYEDKQPRNPRSGERVQKEVVSVRFTPEMLDKIAELAGQSGMSRNGFIESVVMEYVQTELPETADEESADETADEGEVRGDE